jgi:uncharacterized membrane protein YfcA
MSLLLAIALGLLIGLSLGALGGGGSILTVPALVYALGEDARSATTASLVIVGLTAAAAALGHARAGHVRWRAGFAFGGAGVTSSVLGTVLNRRVDPDVLLVCFAALMAVAAVAMLARSREPAEEVRPAGGGLATATTTTTATAVRVVAAGLVVGFLTGFLGVGGGFVIVPALVLTLGFEMPVAVGTSLLVISLNSAVALIARSGNESFHWSVIVPFALAAIAASAAGKRVGDRASVPQLTQAFALLLLAVAAYVAVRALV